MGILGMCMYEFPKYVKYLTKYFDHFFYKWIVFCLSICGSFFVFCFVLHFGYELFNNYIYIPCKYLLPVCGFLFHSPNGVIWWTHALNFNEIQGTDILW